MASLIRLHGSFKQDFISDLHPFYTLYLVLIEVEAQHISGVQIPVIQVFADLLFSRSVISLAPPDLQFNNVLLSQIIDNHIGSCLIPGLRFDII